MSDRRQQVLSVLSYNKNTWVPGYELSTRFVGGSEGLRRLRELRDEGYIIRSKPSTNGEHWEYMLVGKV